MVYFTGTVKVVVCEASDLKPTDFSTRLQASQSRPLSRRQPKNRQRAAKLAEVMGLRRR